jgi:glycosyltransferase involved in cell wall biosynthesis
VSLLPKALDYMVTRGMDPSKFVFVSNGIDEGEWNNVQPLPEDVQARLDSIRFDGLPVVGYTGTHGLANALDVLLDASKLLRGEVNVVLLGAGPERARLEARVADEHLTNVTMFDPVAKAAMPSFLKAIDIGFIGMKPEPLYRFGISHNKLMDYMMAGKLVVLSAEVGGDPVAEAGCGVTVPTGDPVAVANAIRQLLQLSAERRAAMARSGQDFVLTQRTYAVLAQRFLNQTMPTHGSALTTQNAH